MIKIKLIKEYMSLYNLGECEFCRLANISLQSFNTIMNGELEVEIMDLFKIANVLKIKLYQLFE